MSLIYYTLENEDGEESGADVMVCFGWHNELIKNDDVSYLEKYVHVHQSRDNRLKSFYATNFDPSALQFLLSVDPLWT
jgi:hypothetical protein